MVLTNLFVGAPDEVPHTRLVEQYLYLVKVSAGPKRVKGAKVLVAGSGVRKTGRSNGRGMAVIRVNPRRAGIITITALEAKGGVCGPKRIGVVGVFLPPVTG